MTESEQSHKYSWSELSSEKRSVMAQSYISIPNLQHCLVPQAVVPALKTLSDNCLTYHLQHIFMRCRLQIIESLNCWNALESCFCFTLSLNYDMIIPKTNFFCICMTGFLHVMTLVICLFCFHSFILFFMFCCVELLPQDQTPHTTHRFLHLYWESPANCRFQLPRVVPS